MRKYEEITGTKYLITSFNDYDYEIKSKYIINTQLCHLRNVDISEKVIYIH